MPQSDVVIVGGGIVGLATAYRLQQRYPDLSLTIVEAEDRVSAHQSGHNSGVLHSGIYYKPGSEKAICCRAGKADMEAFCDEHNVDWQRCGKVVVATSAQEIPRLESIAERAGENGVEAERIDTDQLRELEPSVAGVAAIHVPETGIVNFANVCQTLAALLQDRGATLRLEFNVSSISKESSSLTLKSSRGDTLTCGRLINCGGLQSDRVCRMTGETPQLQIVPFRGEYYDLAEGSQSLCRNLIYPVPDPSFPFLGVHFTRMVDGGVECGPNAVLALGRAGYSWSQVNVGDLVSTLTYGGFLKLASKHWKMGAGEIHRSLSKDAFVKALQKLIPSIKSSDLVPGRAGVRAQAVTPDGNLVDDFLIQPSDHAIHVLNAPSPAATASLAIGARIVDHFADM